MSFLIDNNNRPIEKLFYSVPTCLRNTFIGHVWGHVTHGDHIKGIAVAAITSAAFAYLFACSNPITGAIFGCVNYIIAATIIQSGQKKEENNDALLNPATCRAGLLALSCVVTKAFVQTILKTQLPYLAAIILAIGAYAGQAVRSPIEFGFSPNDNGECICPTCM